MAVSHLVTYDLIKRKNYPDLIEALERYPSLHCLGSVWILKSDLSCVQIREALLPHIDNDDKLLVVELTSEGAWSASFPDEARKWLKANL